MAAEYIMSEGNYNVILCERGVRTFADHTRNTLDLSIVPAVQRLSHLPIIVDPSHGTGKRNKVTPLSRAAVAVGADGLIIEVHPDPDRALSDGNQSLFPQQFDDLMVEVRQIAERARSLCRRACCQFGTPRQVNRWIGHHSLMHIVLLRLRQFSARQWHAPLLRDHRRAGFDRLPSTPTVEPGYHEYAYITNGQSNSVSVLDLLQLRNVKTIPVGASPTGVAANPARNEIYVANAESNNISIIDAERNVVAATIGVHRAPYFVSVSSDGKRAYVANSGSANMSVIDLAKRAVIATIRVGGAPGLAKVSPDGRLAVVSNRADNTVSIIDTQKLAVRSTVPVCQQPQDLRHPA